MTNLESAAKDRNAIRFSEESDQGTNKKKEDSRRDKQAIFMPMFYILIVGLMPMDGFSAVFATAPEVHLFRSTLNALDFQPIRGSAALESVRVEQKPQSIEYTFKTDRHQLTQIARRSKKTFEDAWEQESGLDGYGLLSLPLAGGVFFVSDLLHFSHPIGIAVSAAVAAFSLKGSELLDRYRYSVLKGRFKAITSGLYHEDQLKSGVFTVGDLEIDLSEEKLEKDKGTSLLLSLLSDARSELGDTFLQLKVKVDTLAISKNQEGKAELTFEFRRSKFGRKQKVSEILASDTKGDGGSGSGGHQEMDYEFKRELGLVPIPIPVNDKRPRNR